MFLKSPDPSAFAEIVDGRLYPVREGVFLVNDADAARSFLDRGYLEADEIPDGVAAELQQEGSFEHDTTEPSKPGAPSAGEFELEEPNAHEASSSAREAELEEELKTAHEEIASLEGRLSEIQAGPDEDDELVADLSEYEIITDPNVLVEVDHEEKKIFASVRPDGSPLEDETPAEEDAEAEAEAEAEVKEPIPTAEELLKLNRSQLDELAVAKGVENPDKLKDKPAVAAAIVAALEAATTQDES